MPETGHTALLPADEQVVTLPLDNGWSQALKVGRLPEDEERPVVVDMDPAADPVLFWAGKRIVCRFFNVNCFPASESHVAFNLAND